jgi:2'-hydroxyisoflavone reductase
VIDNSGYYPAHVKASAELLAPNCGRYIFISSISAYADNKVVGADEDHPLAKLADPNVTDMGPNFANYGGLKALCEQAAQAAFPDRCAVVRPGYIVGPGDPSDRFTYWPVRISRGGEVVAPGSPDDPLQWIDVRDLAEWLVKLAEDLSGVSTRSGPTSRRAGATCSRRAARRARRPRRHLMTPTSSRRRAPAEKTVPSRSGPRPRATTWASTAGATSA